MGELAPYKILLNSLNLFAFLITQLVIFYLSLFLNSLKNRKINKPKAISICTITLFSYAFLIILGPNLISQSIAHTFNIPFWIVRECMFDFLYVVVFAILDYFLLFYA